jgi:hypothetical protein
MTNIESIVRQINREFVPQFEEKLRAYLADQDKDWLIEQIVRLTLDAHSLEEMDRKHFKEEENHRREERAKRVHELKLDEKKLAEFLEKYKGLNREGLIEGKFLKADAPAKGAGLITEKHRLTKGNDLLALSKDMLFGLLFGDEHTNTHFHRTQRELLTLTVPRMKADALDFMKATTELSALGTWQDPKGAANDMQADNVVLEIEYGEMEGEKIGDGVITTLSLINHLEINEEILYGRMENIEQSTLIS